MTTSANLYLFPQVAAAIRAAAAESGSDPSRLLKALTDEMKAAGGRGLSAEDVAGAVEFERLLGSKEAAETALRKLDPKQRKLLEQVSKENANGETIVKISLALKRLELDTKGLVNFTD